MLLTRGGPMNRFFALVALFTVSIVAANASAQSVCDLKRDPHSFACHHDAFEGKTQFPLKNLDWFGEMQGEWFATTYATPNGPVGAGFAMDINPNDPHQPGRGVLNLFSNGFTTILGSMFIQGDQIGFPNWQNAPMRSNFRSLRFHDAQTAEFTSVDRFGIQHLFVCRIFVRNDVDHLNCQWSILNRFGQWDFIGYFGFLTRADWDEFLRNGQH
jgi:hypothetical protein